MTALIVTTRDIATCLSLRRAVFTDEQGIAEADDVDGLDEGAVHLLALLDGRPVGTARLLVAGEVGKVGRVCVLLDQRGNGLGAGLVRAAVAECRAMPGVKKVKLGAQTTALGFYARLGFAAIGPEFDDVGIAHQEMVLVL